VFIVEGDVEGDVNWWIEDKVAELDGYKLFYFDVYYLLEEFWKFYGYIEY